VRVSDAFARIPRWPHRWAGCRQPASKEWLKRVIAPGRDLIFSLKHHGAVFRLERPLVQYAGTERKCAQKIYDDHVTDSCIKYSNQLILLCFTNHDAP
jgi:hypothetical protein